MNIQQSADLPLGHWEVATELQRCAFEAAARVPGGFCPEVNTVSDLTGDPTNPSSRIFPGKSDQLAAVRRFVRSEFARHPALDDAVIAASELAANAIQHTASGHDAGSFIVHLGTMSSRSVCILVMDQGGSTEPTARGADMEAESGRGLDLVTALSAIFVVAGGSAMRSVLVVITADSGQDEGSDGEGCR